jgi:hypothetical protein
VRPAHLDVGLVQQDNRTIDWQATHTQFTRLIANRESIIQGEANHLIQTRADLVLSDMPTLALAAARRAQIPSVLLANFTWDQIYSQCPDPTLFRPDILRELAAEVALAETCLVPNLHLPIPHPNPRSVGLISRLGTQRRPKLLRELGLSQTENSPKLVLVYLGAWGDTLPPGFLPQDSTIRYLSFHPLPPPVTLLDANQWPFHDVLASVDAILAKPGYGVVASALAHGVRLIHHPRPDFAEYPALRASLQAANNLHPISIQDLENGLWQDAVLSALAEPAPDRLEAPGAQRVAQILQTLADQSCSSQPADNLQTY